MIYQYPLIEGGRTNNLLEGRRSEVEARRPRREVLEEESPFFATALGQLTVGDCLEVLRGLGNETVDLVITSPPYDGQPKYGNGEKYERDWYAGFLWKSRPRFTAS